MLVIKQKTFLATHVDHKCRSIAEKSIKIHSPRQQIMNFHFVSFFLLLFHICLKGKPCRYLLDLMVELNNPSFMINVNAITVHKSAKKMK